MLLDLPRGLLDLSLAPQKFIVETLVPVMVPHIERILEEIKRA